VVTVSPAAPAVCEGTSFSFTASTITCSGATYKWF
jgi:hypothetical protein